MKIPIMKKPALLGGIAMGLTLTTGTSLALTYTWTGGAADGDWTNSANWDANGVPVDTDLTTPELDQKTADDNIIINGGAAPSVNVPEFSGGNAFDGNEKTPEIQVLLGTMTVDAGTWSGQGQSKTGFWSSSVGDGDTGNGLAVLNYNVIQSANNGLNRDNTDVMEWNVNADGTLNMAYTRNATLKMASDSSKTIGFNIAGTVVIDNALDLDGYSGNFFDLTVDGASVTADFGADFPDLTAVNTAITGGIHFISTTSQAVQAVDNTDGTFTVSAAVDSTPPSIASTDPVDDATGVEAFANLVATFDEDIALTGAGTITIEDITGAGTDDRTITLPDATQVTVSGTDLTINPTLDLLLSNEYEVTISAGAIQDAAASPNAYAGTASGEWTFTTADPDVIAPLLTGTNPVDDAFGVTPNADLVATFDEDVAAGTGDILINNVTDGGTAATIAVTDGTQVSFAGSVMTISPTTPLLIGKEYAVQIAATAVEDLSGNTYAGIADNTTWSFSTSSSAIFTTSANLGTNNDTWTAGANWDIGTQPSGALSATLNAGLTALANSVDVLTYSGGLTIEAGATLQVGSGGSTQNRVESANALGTGPVTMEAGSKIQWQMKVSPTVPDLVLNGDANITTASNESHGRNFNFSAISGSGQLTFLGVNNQQHTFDTASPSWSGGFVSGVAGNARTRFIAAGEGVFGTGDVTIGEFTDLQINNNNGGAGNAIDDGATLALNGQGRDQSPATKLIMNGSETVNLLTVDGFPYPAGTYGRTGLGGVDIEVGFISGNSVLTVATAPVDSTAPTLSSSTPADEDTGVFYLDPITLVFDEPVLAGAGNILIKNLTDLTTDTVAAGNTGQVAISATTVVITPTAPLVRDKNYAIQIEATAFEDLFGNAYAGIGDDTTLNFTLAGLPSGGVEVTADKIQGTPTYAVQGTLLVIDGPQSSQSVQTISAPQGPDWPEDIDDGWELLGGSLFRENNRTGFEADGTPILYLTGSFSSAASGNQARWTFDLPDGAIVHNVYTRWNYQGNSGSGHIYSCNEGSLLQYATPNSKSINNLTLQWLPSDAGAQNISFERILAGDITVTGGDGFAVTFDAQSGFANIDAVVIDYSLPSGSPYDTWATGGELFGDDENGDGISNGLAFLLGAVDPDADATGNLPTVSENGSGGLVLTFSMLDSASRGTATLNVEHSSDLGLTDAWTVVAVPDSSGGPTDGVTFSVSGSGTLSVTATIGSGEAVDGDLFGRVSATE